MLAVQSLIC